MTAAEREILDALNAGDRGTARVHLGQRIQDREQPVPADADKTGD